MCRNSMSKHILIPWHFQRQFIPASWHFIQYVIFIDHKSIQSYLKYTNIPVYGKEMLYQIIWLRSSLVSNSHLAAKLATNQNTITFSIIIHVLQLFQVCNLMQIVKKIIINFNITFSFLFPFSLLSRLTASRLDTSSKEIVKKGYNSSHHLQIT